MRSTLTPSIVAASALVLAIGGGAACSDGGDSREAPSAEVRRPDSSEGEESTSYVAAADSTGALTMAGGAAQAEKSEPVRDVLRRSALRVRVSDVDRAAERAGDVAASAGGVVFDQTIDLQGETSATMTLKVPPAKLTATIAELKALGTVLEQSESSEDVTERVVDIESRLRSARASADRLRSLLSTAASAADVVAIEGELAKREALAESLDAQHRSLRAQVDMAAVTLTLVEKEEVQVSDEIPGFLDGLKAGSVVLVNAGKVALTSVGAVLPFAPFLAALWFGVKRLRRRGTPTSAPRPELA